MRTREPGPLLIKECGLMSKNDGELLLEGVNGERVRIVVVYKGPSGWVLCGWVLCGTDVWMNGWGGGAVVKRLL